MTENALQPLTDPLSEQEETLLYNIEVLGLSERRAAEVAGVSNYHTVLKRSRVAAAREQLRASLRVRVQITREDVIAGLKKAVDQADILADPMAQIAGWREIAKILGYDKTPNINITLTGTLEEQKGQIKSLSNAELLRLSGQAGVIDADFHRTDE